MSRVDVIKVEWVTDAEVHMYAPEGGTWWARPVPALGGGELWELSGPDDGGGEEYEAEGYYDTAEEAIWAVSVACNDLPVITVGERP